MHIITMVKSLVHQHHKMAKQKFDKEAYMNEIVFEGLSRNQVDELNDLGMGLPQYKELVEERKSKKKSK